MNDNQITAGEASITVTVDGQSKTFTASAATDGNPYRAARGIARSVVEDACSWTLDLEGEAAHRPGWELMTR